MGKRIQITPQIEASIRRAIGDDSADVSSYAVFETRAVSTEAISQSGLFDGARIMPSVLTEMVEHINADGNAVPLITMHNSRMLPIGRVFEARTFTMENGETELRSLFFIPDGGDKAQFVRDIESSLIDEVSVGLETKKILCSECGFDYLGKDADFDNFWMMQCNEGHIIGQDGVHVNMVGFEAWHELSLVSRGAAHNAKILSKEKQKLQSSTRLAANGKPALWLNASFQMKEETSKMTLQQQKTEEKDMTTESVMQLSAALGQKDAKIALLEKEVADAATLTASLKADLQKANEKVAELEKAGGDKATELVAAKEKAEGELKAAIELVAPHVKAALVASGTEEKDVPSDLTAMMKIVEEKGLKLHQIVGAGEGQKSKTNPEDVTTDTAAAAHRGAFKLKKE